jgi:hypothetical protein
MDVEWRAGALRFVSPTGAFPLHTPAMLEAVADRTATFVVRTGRGAGEEVTFTADGSSFALGGFTYRRTG